MTNIVNIIITQSFWWFFLNPVSVFLLIDYNQSEWRRLQYRQGNRQADQFFHLFYLHQSQSASMSDSQRKIVVAITGASGSVYARQLLSKLVMIKDQWKELGIVMSDNARSVWQTELGDDSWKKLSAKFYDTHDFSAPFASGSGRYDTMIIIPCSMGTLGRIASGISNDLVTRAADVILKEKRRLLCVIFVEQDDQLDAGKYGKCQHQTAEPGEARDQSFLKAKS